MPSPTGRALAAATEATPFAQFARWFDEAQAAAGGSARAMTLSTVRLDGRPNARTVILASADERGFVFGTDMTSVKATELLRPPHGASLTFNWPGPKHPSRNVRVDGVATPLSDADADAIFARRPLKSKLGVHVGGQSEMLASCEAWHDRFEEVCQTHLGAGSSTVGTMPREDAAAVTVPRPSHWCGFRVVPDRVEFWEEAPADAPPLHRREVWSRPDLESPLWQTGELAP
uniref:pyridoxal 5'-phosphate synthase n=1 Tax=Neobodo designis TaxID=312471 RepID=A0A7S1L4D8_NEODS|mmetsp:Transcript_14651/g.45423  ORF Transcript_14651/g.45423 Transcript_14651/m.45423 type:complete len:231 (+) Transcript_14651:49-741(+)